MSSAQLLTLNRDEILVLTDRVQNGDRGTEEMPISAYRLLLKLGSLYLETVQLDGKPAEATVAVTEAETWLLRSKVTSGDKLASDPLFGVKLLRKLYTLLLAFDAEVDRLPEAGEDGQQWDAWHKEALGVWRKREDTDAEPQPA